MRTRNIYLVASLSFFILLTTAPALAEGGGQVAADLELGSPVDQFDGNFAIGGGGRFGWRFDLGRVWLQPEAAGHYMRFLGGLCEDYCKATHTHATRVLGGVRIGGAGLISGVIEPALFGHGGYGWLSSKLKGPAVDVGFALDVRVVRVFRFGVHGAYNVVDGQPTPRDQQGAYPAMKWVSFGLHVGAGF